MSLVGSLNTGVSALRTFSKAIQVIGNNIANANTTGFKGSKVEVGDSFSNLLKQASPSPAGPNGSNTDAQQIGSGIQIMSVSADFSQGTLTTTGSETDLAISGAGFFRVRDSANAVDYATRSGNFRVDDRGYLVTSDGFRVQGVTGGTATYDATEVSGSLVYTKTDVLPVAIGDIRMDFSVGLGTGLTNSTGGAFTDLQVEASKPTMSSFTIDTQGRVIAALSSGETVMLGRVLLQDYRDPNALQRAGNNLFTGFDIAGPVGGTALSELNNTPGSNGLGRVESGTLELSNVDMTEEFADIITTQRSFQAGSRIITVCDDILEEVVNLKR